MSSRLVISIFAALVFLAIAGGWLWYRHDPWAFVQPEKSVQRIAVYGMRSEVPGLIVDEDTVRLAFFRPGSCARCDAGFPAPTVPGDLSRYYDVHTSRDSHARTQILELLSPMNGYGASPAALDLARRRGFGQFAARKPIACDEGQIGSRNGDFIVMDWGDRPEQNDITVIHTGCATSQSDAALARIAKAFEIAAEATNTDSDPRSRFRVERLTTD